MAEMTAINSTEKSDFTGTPAGLAMGLTAPAIQLGEGVTTAIKTAFEMVNDFGREVSRRHRRNKSIRTLNGLSNHTLKDIGMSRSDIYRMADEMSRQSK
jgi:uncharacterized protein YjiS (DUF1127 family)